MKKTLWILLVIIALWLGATWYSGKRIETQLNDAVASFNMKPEKSNSRFHTQIKSLSYERGLLSSHARYALTANEMPSDSAPEIAVTIWHGPFPRSLKPNQFALHAELVPSGVIKMATGALMGGKPPLVTDISCSYGNRCSGTGNVPAIDYDADKSFNLTFGGLQSQFDFDWNEFSGAINTQFLPLSINGQDFGSGKLTMTGSPLGSSNSLSWKTDQGESKASLSYALTKPTDNADFEAVKPEEEAEEFIAHIKTVSINVSLSRPMLVDIGARAATLNSPSADLATAQKEVNTQIDDFLNSNPQAKQYLRAQGDAITGDLQYADGRLTLNGQENPELLAQLKQELKQSFLKNTHSP